MKKIYNPKFLISNWKGGWNVLTIGLIVFAFSAIQNLTAQTTLQWTGTVSSDANNTANWSPQQALAGNVLVVDSAFKFTNQPVIGGTGNIDVSNLTLQPTSNLTINRTNASDQITVTSETPQLWGTINL